MPPNQKGFSYKDIPEHLVPIFLRVFGNEHQEHPDNEEVRRLIKTWLEKREIP